ncbi:MAG: hypothetical protein JSV92_02525 [archaeon]|nr:MAG: hypothetical protein JSV92_02525 [archaeon]
MGDLVKKMTNSFVVSNLAGSVVFGLEYFRLHNELDKTFQNSLKKGIRFIEGMEKGLEYPKREKWSEEGSRWYNIVEPIKDGLNLEKLKEYKTILKSVLKGKDIPEDKIKEMQKYFDVIADYYQGNAFEINEFLKDF